MPCQCAPQCFVFFCLGAQGCASDFYNFSRFCLSASVCTCVCVFVHEGMCLHFGLCLLSCVCLVPSVWNGSLLGLCVRPHQQLRFGWPAATGDSLRGTKSYVTLLLAHLPHWPSLETLSFASFPVHLHLCKQCWKVTNYIYSCIYSIKSMLQFSHTYAGGFTVRKPVLSIKLPRI